MPNVSYLHIVLVDTALVYHKADYDQQKKPINIIELMLELSYLCQQCVSDFIRKQQKGPTSYFLSLYYQIRGNHVRVQWFFCNARQ